MKIVRGTRSKRWCAPLVALALGVLSSASPLPAAAGSCCWNLFPTVNPVPSGNQLVGVAGTGPSDVWEIGADFEATTSYGYALHWNGRAWSTFAQPNPTGHGGQYSGIVALAPHDVWGVGQVYTAANYSGRRAVVEHWNGAQLIATPVPPVGTQETFLYAVAANGPGDIWAAGGTVTAAGRQGTYVVHWDGRRWARSTAVDVAGAATNLDALARTSARDVWSVGGWQANTSSPFHTLAEHWDGTRWRIVPTPNVNANSNVFNAVVAISPRNVWAIGDYYNGTAFSPLAEHWDGTRWSIVPTPDSGAQTAFVLGATGTSASAVWAVGEIAEGGGAVATYILHWNGVRWSRMRSPNAPHELVTLLNGVASLPGGTTWAVGGTANTSIVIHTVTEILDCRDATTSAQR